MEQFSVAMMNRSVRNIKTELEFLSDAGHITPSQLDTILSQLPDAPAAGSSRAPSTVASPQPVAAPTPSLPIRNGNGTPANTVTPVTQYPPPQTNNNNSNNNEKVGYYASNPTPPPPAYAAAPPAPAALCSATALYAYAPTDAGDLALQANDRVQVTEYMNAEWWKGRSERTGQEGIFPRSYVRVDDSKIPAASPTPAQQSMSYGNMPMAVSQGGGDGSAAQQQQQQQPNGQPSKGQEMGKKFGKKLGNAAIFGAGATIGSNIVNGIL